jgi:short-subunit dehydrogenase
MSTKLKFVRKNIVMETFKQKVVLVTGGSDGIGKALVELLLNLGASVVTCGRSLEKFEGLQANYHHYPLLIVQADVSVEADCMRLIDDSIRKFGKLDVLINNAGISMRALVEETDTKTLRQVMDINFWGTVYCTKYALPYLIKQKGVVVGVSSIAGYRGLPGRSGYSASKFAVQGWLESLRTEMMESGVHVMWVCPGFTASNIRNSALNKDAVPQKESPLDEEKLMTAAECATHILNSIEKKKRTLVLTFTGKRTVWINRLFPGWADRLVYKFFFKNGQLIR